MKQRLRPFAQAWPVIVILVAAVIVAELSDASVRSWMSQRPFMTSIASGALLLILTVLGVEVLLRKREDSRWRRMVGPAYGTWVQRAHVLVIALGFYGTDADEGRGLHLHYRQAGFGVTFAWVGQEPPDFDWLEPALREWVGETRVMLPLLAVSPEVFEGVTRMMYVFEACVGGFAFHAPIGKAEGQGEHLPDFLHEMAPVADRAFKAMADILDFEIVDSETAIARRLPQNLTPDARVEAAPTTFEDDDIPF